MAHLDDLLRRQQALRQAQETRLGADRATPRPAATSAVAPQPTAGDRTVRSPAELEERAPQDRAESGKPRPCDGAPSGGATPPPAVATTLPPGAQVLNKIPVVPPAASPEGGQPSAVPPRRRRVAHSPRILGTSALGGSPRQIGWATDIRAGFWTRIESCVRTLAAAPDTPGELRSRCSEILFYLDLKNAKFWIERRERSAAQIVEEMIRTLPPPYRPRVPIDRPPPAAGASLAASEPAPAPAPEQTPAYKIGEQKKRRKPAR